MWISLGVEWCAKRGFVWGYNRVMIWPLWVAKWSPFRPFNCLGWAAPTWSTLSPTDHKQLIIWMDHWPTHPVELLSEAAQPAFSGWSTLNHQAINKWGSQSRVTYIWFEGSKRGSQQTHGVSNVLSKWMSHSGRWSHTTKRMMRIIMVVIREGGADTFSVHWHQRLIDARKRLQLIWRLLSNNQKMIARIECLPQLWWATQLTVMISPSSRCTLISTRLEYYD